MATNQWILSRKKLKNSMAVIGLFVLLSIPSIKLLFSSNVVNLSALIVLLLANLIRLEISWREKQAFYLAWLFITFILLVLLVVNERLNAETTTKFMYLCVSVFLVIMLAEYSLAKSLVPLLIGWAVFVAFWQLLFRIQTSEDLGQNYLTVSMPIGAGLAVVLCRAALENCSLLLRAWWLFISAILVLSLLTLLSRSAILFPLIIFSTFTIIFASFNRVLKLRDRVLIVSILGFSILAVAFYILPRMEEHHLSRIMRLLESTSEEPRIAVYMKAINIISESALYGHGAGSSTYFYFGSYPHNIFLDILINGGLLLLVPFVVIFATYGILFVAAARNSRNGTIIGMFSLSLFFFMQWNTSFSLDAAYIPLASMVVAIFACDEHLRSSCRIPDNASGRFENARRWT